MAVASRELLATDAPTLPPSPSRWMIALLLTIAACLGLRESRQNGAPDLLVASLSELERSFDVRSLPSEAGLALGVESNPFGPWLEKVATLGAEAAESAAPPSDVVSLVREGHVSIPGGILVFPSSFQPKADGAYDLLIHFHGNTAVVRESAEVTHLNAAVAIINLGIGSAAYEECYGVFGTYEDLLADIESGVRRRGLKNAHLRRVALSAWSAGYGSVATIAAMRRGVDPLDAILIFDGIHAGFENGTLNHRQMKPFADLAKRAAFGGDIYFGITHSAIDPKAYASTSRTADYLLAVAETSRAPRDPIADQGPYLELESMKGAVSKKLEKRLEPTSYAKRDQFEVYGYTGETKEHHMAHLFQMGATLLPTLKARWDKVD